MSELRIWLMVPYEERHEAKRLGARWDADVRQWWISLAGVQEARNHAPRWFEGGHFAVCVEGALYLVQNEVTCSRCRGTTPVVGLLAHSAREFWIGDDEEEWGPVHAGPVFLSDVRRIGSERLRQEVGRSCPTYRPGRYRYFRNHCVHCDRDVDEHGGSYAPQQPLVPPEHGRLGKMKAWCLPVTLPSYLDAGLSWFWSDQEGVDLYSSLLRNA